MIAAAASCGKEDSSSSRYIRRQSRHDRGRTALPAVSYGNVHSLVIEKKIRPMALCLTYRLIRSKKLTDLVIHSWETEDGATGERTTRVARPRGGMKVAARIGEGPGDCEER